MSELLSTLLQLWLGMQTQIFLAVDAQVIPIAALGIAPIACLVVEVDPARELALLHCKLFGWSVFR